MGGVAGHMDHLYDNPDLTFAKMKKIMAAASNGELKAEEKVDGQNLFLSYSIPEGKAKGARNKGNLKQGGLDASGLATKFAGRGNLLEAFRGGFEAFEKAVEVLSDEEKKKIFGPDTNIWYNAEIMDPGAMNVIKYDGKTLKIHDVGHFIFDRETGEKSAIPNRSLAILDNSLERMQKSLEKNDFSLARKALIRLQSLEDDKDLNKAVTQIDSALSQVGLRDDSTIEKYVYERLINGIDISMPLELKKEIVNYLMKLPGNIGLKALKKGLSQERLLDLNNIVAAKRSLLQEAIEPIEMVVHDFSVAILKGLESVFIANTDEEVSRLKVELSKAVQAITAQGEEDPQLMSVLQRHLNKIKDYSLVTTPIEAIVFDYDGHTYKFAGNFAPLNQILGMFRYPRGGKKLTTENISFDTQVITEKSGKKVAILPGGFKPPHAGHYGLAKHLSSDSDVDEVVVIIGKKSRFSEVDPKIELTAEQSKKLWDIYTSNDENIKVIIQKGTTPVADVYDLIADKNAFSEGDTVFLGKSDKDVGDKRYARAQSWAEMHNPGVNVEEKVFPVIGGKSMGGTALRNLIASGDKNGFKSKLPTHLSEEDKTKAWELVSSSTSEALNQFIDNKISEMSSMGGGSVAGQAGGFGPPNTFNPYRTSKKPKTKKPSIKRAKRQRRR
jgi:hypothetical protein